MLNALDAVTEPRSLGETKQNAKETITAVIDASPVAIICVAPDQRVLLWSHGAERIFGYTAAETLGQPYKLVTASGEAEFKSLFQRALAGEILRNIHMRRLRKDGSLVHISFAGAATYDDCGTVTGVAYVLEDITERKQAQEKLRHLAHYDELTGLPNRTSLQFYLEHSIGRNGALRDASISLALFDLDGFKDVNDTLGHSIGDELLKKVARRLSANTSRGAQVYRLGGDEFVLIFPNCGDPRTVAQAVDSSLREIAKPFEVNDHVLYIESSAGIAIAPADGSTAEELIANADLALHEAKSHGGRTYRVFRRVLRAQAEARRNLEVQLRHAFAHQEFEIHFQPQVRLADNMLTGAEALLRWRPSGLGRAMIRPGAFIDTLAASPIAREVGTWVLRTACEKVAGWRARDLPLVRVGINLFPVQFRDGLLVKQIEEVLLDTGLPPAALELEITENIALGHGDPVFESLQALRQKGVSIALDDFGTGYASLSSLVRYPLSRIKLDRGFVLKIPEDAAAVAIVRSLITLAHNLRLEVTAEGVETQAQADFLRAEGCEEAQGFLYEEPLPAKEFQKLLSSGSVLQYSQQSA